MNLSAICRKHREQELNRPKRGRIVPNEQPLTQQAHDPPRPGARLMLYPPAEVREIAMILCGNERVFLWQEADDKPAEMVLSDGTLVSGYARRRKKLKRQVADRRGGRKIWELRSEKEKVCRDTEKTTTTASDGSSMSNLYKKFTALPPLVATRVAAPAAKRRNNYSQRKNSDPRPPKLDLKDYAEYLPLEEGAPGPGSYTLPSVLGDEKHTVTKQKRPAYSFGRRHTHLLDNSARGPGPQYLPEAHFTRLARPDAPGILIKGRPSCYVKRIVRMPAAQYPEKINYTLPVRKRRLPGVSLQYRATAESHNTTAPGRGRLPRTMGHSDHGGCNSV